MSWRRELALQKKAALDRSFQTVKRISWLCLILIILGIGSCTGWNKLSTPYTEKQPVRATLELAYEYQDRCGKHKHCSAYMGRFKEEATGQMWNRKIMGWSYHSFVQNGRTPEPGWTIEISQEDRGNKIPAWIGLLAILGSIMIIGPLSVLFGFWISYGMDRDMFWSLYGEDLK